MNTLSKIAYAATIETGSTFTDSTVGLDAGVFRWITDFDMAIDATYESGSDVTGTWDDEILAENGIKTATQSIDITVGGDYAFLASASVSLLNVTGISKKIIETEDFHVIGRPATIYIIIDGVFYTRWSGTVSGFSFTDTAFNITMSDKNNSDSGTVDGLVFGNTTITPVDSGTGEPLYSDVIISHSRIDGDSLRNSNYMNPNFIDDLPPSGETSLYTANSTLFFNGFSHRANYKITSTNNTSYNLFLQGYNSNVREGMLVKFTGVDRFFVVNEVHRTSADDVYSDSGLTAWSRTRLVVSDYPDSIIDYAQFYGLQPQTFRNFSTDINDDIVARTSEITKDTQKITATFYDKTLTVTPPAGSSLLVRNGSVVAVDSSGNDVLVDAEILVDGSAKLIETKTTTIKKPLSVRVASLDRDAVSKLDLGTLKNLEAYGFTTFNITNDFHVPSTGIDGFRLTPKSVCPSLLVDFGDGQSGGEFSILMRNHVEANPAVWIDRIDDDTTYPTYIGSSADMSGFAGTIASQRSVLFNVDSDEEFFNAFTNSLYEINAYKIAKTKEWGDVPVYMASMTLPNSFSVTSKTKGAFWDDRGGVAGEGVYLEWIINGKGSIATNSKKRNIVDDETKPLIRCTDGNLWTWVKPQKSDTEFDNFDYPDGLVESDKIASQDFTGTWLFTITRGYNDLSGGNTERNNDAVNVGCVGFEKENGTVIGQSAIDNETFFCGFNTGLSSGEFSVQIHSVGLEKNTEIDSISDLKFKTVSSSTNTLSGALSSLSGVTVNLSNRSTWYVGAFEAEQVNKFSVITSMCRQSFVAGYSNRFGVPTFREVGTFETARAFDSSNILDGSIVDFSNTPIEKTYNNFAINYGKTGSAFSKKIELKNVSGTFPIESENWADFVSGIPSYSDAKGLFEKAHSSFALNKRDRLAPQDRTNLDYAVDLNSFYGVETYDSTVEYARAYTDLFVYWSTRQKFLASFSVPITAENATIEIADSATFSDRIVSETASDIGRGWIASVSTDTKRNSIKLQIMFEPDFMVPPSLVQGGDIVETGLSDTDIIETGTNTDNIIEGGN